MFEDSYWIDAVHSCSDTRSYWWSASAEMEVFNASGTIRTVPVRPSDFFTLSRVEWLRW
jgi:hypothetical protein